MSLAKRLASQSSVIFAARIVGSGIIFLVQAAIARYWGAAVLGNYLLIVAIANLIMVFMPLGFQTVGTYFVSEYRAKKDAKMLRKFIWRAYSHIGIMAIIVALLILPISSFFDSIADIISIYWMPIVLLAFAIAIIYLNSAILVGLKRPFAAFLTEALFRPLMLVASFILALFVFSQSNALMALLWGMSLSFMFLAILQFFIVIFSVAKIEDEVAPRNSEVKRWWRFAAPWVLIALATDFFFDIDLIILSGFLQPQELAIFGVSAKIFTLAAFGVVAVYAVVVPDIFEAEANNDRAGFLQKIGEANLVAAGLSLILLIGIAIMGKFALGIFGEEFTQGLWPLVIMCSALLVRSIFGPASLVLSIYDRPYASLPAVFVGLGSLVALNYLLVPAYGLMGAAISALVAITIWSIAQWYIALKIAKVDVSIFSALRKKNSTLVKT